MAVKRGVVFVKWVIVAVILFTAGDMFGLYDFRQVFTVFLK